MLVHATHELEEAGYDPADLPDRSTSFRVGFVRITASLKDGTFEGLSGITRNGNTTATTVTTSDSNINNTRISGNLRMGQGQGFFKASVAGLSADVEATVDHVDMYYEIEYRVGQIMNLTRFEITDVGTIDVEISGLGSYLSRVTNLATNLISDYIAGTFEDEVQVAIQNYLTSNGPFVG